MNTSSTNGTEYPLHVAVENESVKVITALVSAGAELDVTDIRGNTPLHLASGKVVPIIQVKIVLRHHHLLVINEIRTHNHWCDELEL